MEQLNMQMEFDIKSEPSMLMISTSNGSTVDGSFFVNALEDMAQSNMVTTPRMVNSEPTTPNILSVNTPSTVVVVQPITNPILSQSQTIPLITNSASITIATQPSLSANPLQSPTVTAAMQSSPTSLSNNSNPDLLATSSAAAHFAQPGEGHLAIADSNSPKQVFVPCKVCGDKASGYHYGVTSCEGCKGFFRRSIQKQIEYRCLRDGKCLVMRLNRNRCQYCRFKKCLAVGMSRDSVRYGRVPKRSRSLDEQRVTTTGDSPPACTAPPVGNEVLQESRQLAMYDIILTMSQAHHANCLTTEDKVKNLSKKPLSLLDKLDMGVGDPLGGATSLDGHRCRVFENLASLVTPVINLVVSFAKQVPGFGDLSQDDQLILIKAGFFEIWLTRMVRMLNPTDNTVMFGDGSVVSRTELELVYSPELVASMFSFAKGFVALRLNDTEIGIFTGVVLATPDRQGLSNKKAVEVTQDRLIEALKLQITRNHALEPNLFASILMRIPELRTLGSKHGEQLNWFRKNWIQLNLPPLYAEIYDVPRLDTELLGAGGDEISEEERGTLHIENYPVSLQ